MKGYVYGLLSVVVLGAHTMQPDDRCASISVPIVGGVYDKSDETVFAFDLHDVISIKQPGEITKALWAMMRDHPILTLRFAGSLYRLPGAMRKTKVAELIIEEVMKDSPRLHTLRPYFQRVINAQQVKPEMVRLLNYLHDQGYTLIFASNIGPRALELYSNVLQREGVWQVFSDYVTPRSSNNFAYKPTAAFYEELRRKAHGFVPGARIILVDDKTKNILAARSFGIDGYVFTGDADFVCWLKQHGFIEPGFTVARS